VIAGLRRRLYRRRLTANRSPWGDDLTRMVDEVRAVRRRNGKRREQMRRLLRRLPW
jgi:hypothetical protein